MAVKSGGPCTVGPTLSESGGDDPTTPQDHRHWLVAVVLTTELSNISYCSFVLVTILGL